mmetsp:Transcript_18170/g.25665  ORF Transcript_18170/g.25665 Transcript_18170/m.25665 type:complete len:105 (-) Transcript_18170:560-874(-)
MQQLQKEDGHIGFAPWDDFSTREVGKAPAQISQCSSELKTVFPRVNFRVTGSTWYSGVRLIHEMSIADIRKDILRWLKEEGHGLFEGMLQCKQTMEIGWLVYSS